MSETQIAKRVEQERIAALYGYYRYTIPMNLLFALAWGVLTYQYVPAIALAGWMAAMVILVVIRILLAHRRVREKGWLTQPAKLENEFLIGTGLIGLLWGAGIWLFIPPLPPLQHAVILVLIFGIASGAFISMVTSPRCYNAFCWPMILSAAATLALDPASRELALILLAFSLIFIFSTFQRMHVVVLRGLQGIAEREQLVRQLEAANLRVTRLSNIDPLTGIANRRRFNDELESSWRGLKRKQQPLALVMIDIDGFKAYNDHYGHPQGDVVLKAVAQLLPTLVKRPDDLAARYGGEEFALILPDTGMPGARKLAGRIHAGLAKLNIPHAHSPASDRLTVSVGIASRVPNAGTDPKDLLEIADRALYQAKISGRNRTCEAPQIDICSTSNAKT